MRAFGLFANAVYAAEVEDGFITNRRPMSDDQRKAIYAGGGGGKGFKRSVKPGKGGNKNKKIDPHAGFYAAPNINDVRKKFPNAFRPDGRMKPGYSFGQDVTGRITSISRGGKSTRIGPPPAGGIVNGPPGSSNKQTAGTYSVYRPPVDVKDMQPPWSAQRDLGRRISEYEDRTGQRWPGPTTVDTMPPNYPGGGRRIPIDPGGAIGQDSMGNPIFRGPNGNPVVYDQKTGGWRPPGLQMPAIPVKGPQLGGPGGPVKSVTSIKGLSVEEAAARRNETKPGTIERMIAEQDLMVAMKIEDNRRRALGGASQLIAVDDTSSSYNPKPGYGTPPSQRGGMRTHEFRDGDGDGIDDRDQDGPGMPKYGTPGYKKPGIPDQRILPVEPSPPVRTLPVRDDMRDGGYNPTPGYGTPPSQRGGMRTQEFRDSDRDGVDDRDQDGPGMPRYGRPGVGAPGLITTPGFRVPDQSGPPWGYIPPNLRQPSVQPGLPVPDQSGPPWGYIPPNVRQPTPYVPPENRYSSSDPNWKQKMLAVQNKGSIAGRMAERRVQMTEPGWSVEMGGQMSGSYVPETLRRVRQFGFLS